MFSRETEEEDLDMDQSQVDTEQALIRLEILVQQVAELERENARLQRKTEASSVHLSASVADAETNRTSSFQLQQQAAAEEQVRSLRLRVSSLESRLSSVDGELTETKRSNDELRRRNESLEVEITRTIAENTAEQRHRDLTATDAGNSEVRSQTAQLQMIIQKVEAQLQSMKMLADAFSQLSPRSQSQQRDDDSESRHLQSVMDDFEVMKRELELVMSQNEQLQHKLEAHKLQWKNKYQQLKEETRSERSNLHERMKKLENDLRLTKNAIAKEHEYKKAMTKRHQDILTEQRSMITRLSDQDELLQDRLRQLLIVQMRAAELERDNKSLNQTVDDLNSKQNDLKKNIRDLQMEKQKVEWYKLISATAPSNTVTVLTSSLSKAETASA